MGENKGIPIVIELTDYVADTYIGHGRTSQNEASDGWGMEIPIDLFAQITIETDMELYICSDDFNRESVVCKCRKLRAKKYNYGLYTFEMKNDANGFAVYIRKRYFIFQTQFMCISDNMLKTAIVVPDVFKTADSIIELYFCPNLFDEREAEAYEFNKNVEWIYKNSNSVKESRGQSEKWRTSLSCLK